MDRRWFGAIVVACTVLAAVVAPNVTARRVGGTAIPVAIDAPPAVGSCALTITDPWSSNPETGFAVGNVIDYPTARFGPCAGAAVGEVVFVDAATSPPEQVVDNDYQTILQQCALDAIGYLGSIPPVVYRGIGQPGIVWSSVLAFRYTAIGPSAVQRAAGQRWSACAVGSTEAKPYVGRLRNVLVHRRPASGVRVVLAFRRPQPGRGPLRLAARGRTAGLEQRSAPLRSARRNCGRRAPSTRVGRCGPRIRPGTAPFAPK